MDKKNRLLKLRFEINMGRIARLTKLSFSSTDALEPMGLFKSEGARADILRAIVVFLHAAFEDVLRSHDSNKTKSYYSIVDIEKALKRAGIDAQPFKTLYPPLTQLAKRRKRIVHNADLSDFDSAVLEDWNVADYWQLIMWNLAVVCFFYELIIATNSAGNLERKKYQTLREVMSAHVNFGKQLIEFSEVPPEKRMEALLRVKSTLEYMSASLKSDAHSFSENEP